MHFKQLATLCIVCLSFNLLQGSYNKKSVAELAEQLTDVVDVVRYVVQTKNRVEFLQEIRGLDDDNYVKYQNLKTVEKVILVKVLQIFEATSNAVDDYLQGETVDGGKKVSAPIVSEEIIDIET